MFSSKSADAAHLCVRAIQENGVRHILAQVTPLSPRFLLKSARVQQVDEDQVLVLRLALTAPPEEGRANAEARDAIAALCQVPSTQVMLTSGHQSRSKRFFLSL